MGRSTVTDMAERAASDATERLGDLLPADPSVEDVKRLADRLRSISDSHLSAEVINRVPLNELEARRRRALDR